MAIQPKCNKCGYELDEYGAILLSPPNNQDMVHKFHICVACYQQIVAEFDITKL